VTSNSAQALRAALAQQPVSVVIEADQLAFQFYSTGVLTTGCGDNLDHAVLAVGYGTNSQGQQYFKIKNSWGSTWGDNGYVYFGADDTSNAENSGSGVCGVLSLPTFPTM
jgi:KDEL-tailed cysteine endopeptidase